jgi:short-subunit dehydrogenase involved in D-alanine esterification of teichoic acids
MAPKTLDFKCAVITGGGGGLGKAMAESLIKQGKKVIVVGRTEETLKKTAEELGHNTAYYKLDTGDISSIPSFVKKVTSEHPEVDCLINNAGVQRPLNINNFDLSKADQELDINIRGPMHLAINFLPHFKSKPAATIMNVSSVLGFIPFSIINPVYNATKAWVHFWTMNLRTQLKDSNVKIVEIVPPMVATDLHREREDPDDNKKEKAPQTLTVDEFMEYVDKGWNDNLDTVAAGMGVKIVERWYKEFGEDYKKAESK